MSDFEKPFADAAPPAVTYIAPAGASSSAHHATARSARRAAAPPASGGDDAFGGAVLDASATENRPCSVDNRADNVLPGRRIW